MNRQNLNCNKTPSKLFITCSRYQIYKLYIKKTLDFTIKIDDPLVFNGTSAQRGDCANCGGGKPAQATKDDQRVTRLLDKPP